MHDELTVLSHPARVRLGVAERSAELLELVKGRDALDDDVLMAHPPFFWRAEISNDHLDSHFTHMAESSLRNYGADAKVGVAFLKGHDRRSLPIGYSLSGSYEDVGGKKRVVADFYTVSGLPETDDLILRMRSGILRDVSIGFHGGKINCDLCQRDFWECPHFPGLKYEVKEGDVIREKIATFTIEDARLSEVSGVFDGSTPGAMILKAQERAGELTAEQTQILEQRYRVKLPATKRAFAGVELRNGQTPREGNSMTIQEDFSKVRSLVEVETDDEVVPAVETLKRRVSELEPQAAEGRQYRTDLVTSALAEGVRAYGNDFDKAAYEAILTSAPLATVKRMAADWQKTADAALPNGRTSTDDAEDGKTRAESVQLVPDAAYAS